MKIKPPVNTLQTNLPFDDLTWKEFELFGNHLISLITSEFISCDPYLSEGYKQEGIDAIATRVDGKRCSVQYKRIKSNITLAAAKKIIAKTTFDSPTHLVVTKAPVAKAAFDLLSKDGWEIWDSEIILSKVSHLRLDSARILIKRHFSDQWVESFLGIPAFSIFLTPKTFFEEYNDPTKIFSHAWAIVGRGKELDALHKFIDSENQILLISGRGGIGKSKLLYEFSNKIQKNNDEWTINFVNTVLDPEKIGIEDLSNDPTILIIDDAHRYYHLQSLLALIEQHVGKIKIILSVRPNGEQYIKNLFINVKLSEVTLSQLSFEERQILAIELLGANYNRFANEVSALLKESTLIGVFAAYLIKVRGITISAALNDKELRHQILAKFEQEIMGNISDGKDAEVLRSLLQILSIIAPVHSQNESLINAIAVNLGLPISKLNSYLSTLRKAQIVILQNNVYQIKPDLLSDYILETACLTEQGEDNGYIQEMYRAYGKEARMNILRNVAELDWRINADSVQERKLLDCIWTEIERELKASLHIEQKQMLKNLVDIAPYQPARVLPLINDWLKSQHGIKYKHTLGISEHLCTILKAIAYQSDSYMRQCVNLLWMLTKELINIGVEERNNHPYSTLLNMSGYSYGRYFRDSKSFLDAFASTTSREFLEKIATLHIFQKYLVKSGYGAYHVEGKRFSWIPYKLNVKDVRDMRGEALSAIETLSDTKELTFSIEVIKVLKESLKRSLPCI